MLCLSMAVFLTVITGLMLCQVLYYKVCVKFLSSICLNRGRHGGRGGRGRDFGSLYGIDRFQRCTI